MLTKLIIAGLSLSGICAAQAVQAPAYSTARVNQLIHAIGRAEGFGVRGSKATRNHNPGNMKLRGQYRHFLTDADGFAALRDQIVKVLQGRSKAYTLDTTLASMGRRYAGPARWAANVAKILKVPVSATLRGFLCDGDLDVPPAIDFTK